MADGRWVRLCPTFYATCSSKAVLSAFSPIDPHTT
jgi:hypothetical protein